MIAESGQEAFPEAKVFISYSRRDAAFADRLDAALKAHGFAPLIDRSEVYAFEDWWKRIAALISAADTIVFVLSPDAVASEVALKEVAHAASLNKRFAPIVCRQVQLGAVPEVLRRLNFIFMDDASQFEERADALADALHTDIEWIRQHTEYGEAARRWAAAGHSGSLLLRSPILEVAEHWTVSRPRGAPEPTELTRSFIAESRQGAHSAQRRRRRVQALIYTLLVSIIAGLIGWINQEYVKERWNWVWIMRPYMLAQVRPYVLSVEREAALKPGDLFRECANNDCPQMVVIPPGIYQMGAIPTDMARFEDESPQHEVTIAQRFAIARFDVTFAEWETCVRVGGCPEVADNGYGRDTRPVINVSWPDAQRYVAWFAKMTGKPYRLLTETEWEHAARAGTATVYPWGDEIGEGNTNCDACGSPWDNKRTSPVGSFAPNAFNLYDMAGNVWQWVEDCFHSDYNGAPNDNSAWTSGDCSRRVLRGGSWYSPKRSLRSAARLGHSTNGRSDNIGFRIGRTLPP